MKRKARRGDTADLVAAEPDPLVRFVKLTRLAKKDGWLPSALVAQRRADLAILLAALPATSIAAEANLSRQRVHRLARLVRGECSA